MIENCTERHEDGPLEFRAKVCTQRAWSQSLSQCVLCKSELERTLKREPCRPTILPKRHLALDCSLSEVLLGGVSTQDAICRQVAVDRRCWGCERDERGQGGMRD